MTDTAQAAVATVTKDPNPVASKQGYGKAGAGILSVVATNIVAPSVYHWLLSLDPNLSAAGAADIVDALQALAVGNSVYLTPHNFVGAVKDGLIFVRDALKSWKDAWEGKDQSSQ